MNKLQELRTKSIIVADTGDIDEIRKHKPQDATTNPSIVLKAITTAKYRYFFDEVVKQIKKLPMEKEKIVQLGCDHLAIALGKEILSHIEGYVSTEVDATLSFDTQKTVERAQSLIRYYETVKVPKERVLIKIAATWPGILAAAELEKLGIKCNMTLLFDIAQAQASAEHGVYLISPFVGRILDWYTKNQPAKYTADNDPGVKSVKEIFSYYRSHKIKTIIMAASFRNTDQIEALAGCDRLTIAPDLLQSLQDDNTPLARSITDNLETEVLKKTKISEAQFYWQMNQSAMATEKLAEGIRKFSADKLILEQMIRTEIN